MTFMTADSIFSIYHMCYLRRIFRVSFPAQEYTGHMSTDIFGIGDHVTVYSCAGNAATVICKIVQADLSFRGTLRIYTADGQVLSH